MATQLAVISSVERLWPHEDSGATFVFGLNLQIAVVTGSDVPADLDWLRPWMWELLEKVEFWAFGKDSLGNAVSSNLLTIAAGSAAADVLEPRPSITQLGAVAKALERRRDEMHKSGGDAIYFFDPAPENLAADPPPAGFHRQILAAAGTLPGPISHRLNLAACVEIPLTRVVDTFLNSSKTDFQADLKVLAAPHFARKVGADTFSFTPKNQGPTGGSPVYRWDYEAAPATAPVNAAGYTVAVQPLVLDPADEDHRYLRLSDYWIARTAGGAQPPDPGEDWPVRLAERVADAWNLPRHLLDAVEGLAALPGADFQRLWEAALAAIRDRAGLGLIDTPDGRGLFRRAADQALPSVSDPIGRLVQNAKFQSLRAKLCLADRTLTLAVWQAQFVAAVAPALADKVPATPQVPPRRVTVAWPAMQAVSFPALVPVTLQRAGRADAPDAQWTAVPGLSLTLPTASTPDGGKSVAFPLYQAAAAVEPGWFRGQAGLMSGPVISLPVAVGQGLADDLAPLARALSAIQNDETLAALVGGAWDQIARNYVLELDAGTTSPPAYTDTKFVTDGHQFTNPRWIESGALDLANGDSWVITLGRVRLLQTSTATPTAVWVPDAGYNLEFAAGPIDVPTATLRVSVTLGLTGGATPDRQLTVALDWSPATPMTPPPAAVTISDPELNKADAVHLRIVFSRAAGKTHVDILPDWFADGPVPSVGWKPACLSADLPDAIRLSEAAVRVKHHPAPGGQPLRLEAVPPTILSAAASDLTVAVNVWDGSALDKGRVLWELSGPAFFKDLARLQPRRRLALGQTARLWPVWNYYKEGPVDFRKFIQEQIGHYLGGLDDPQHRGGLADQRFGWSSAVKAAGPYRDFAPDPSMAPSSDLQKRIGDALAKFAQHLIDTNQFLPPPAGGIGAAPLVPEEQPADLTTTPTPHALNLNVDRPGTFDGRPGSDDDLLRRLSGVGLLIRQAAAHPNDPSKPFDGQPWRMPNAASLQALDTPDPADPEKSIYLTVAERVAAPVRLHYRDDARQTVVTYDNQPLAARSPLTEIARAKGFRDKPPENPDELVGPFRSVPPGAAGGGSPVPGYPWELLPSLKFGQFYELLPFLLGNAGTFPKALANGHPAALRDTGLPDVPQAAQDHIRRVLYLRRVTVGPPRLDRPPGPKPNLPPIPADVLPLARELGMRALTAAYPVQRFFYDSIKAAGQLTPRDRWRITFPRVAVTGRPYLPDTNPTNVTHWTIRIGLQGDDATSQPAGSMVAVTRDGATLKAAPDGLGEKSASLQSDGQNILGGPLDLKLARDEAALALSWRRSDRGEDWSSVRLTWTLASLPTLDRAYVVAESRDASGQPADGPTFGIPLFDSPLTGEIPPPPDEPPLIVLPPSPPALAGDPAWLRFGIRPPATDLSTWARWFDMDLFLTPSIPARQLRQDVWTTYYQLLPVPPPNPPQPGVASRATGPDLTLDDPAVTKLLFELVPLLVEPATAMSQTPARLVSVRPTLLPQQPGYQGGLSGVQSSAYQISVEAPPDPGALRLVVDETQGTVQVLVAEQEIWELRVHPAVAAGFFERDQNHPAPGAQRFHTAFSGTDYKDPATGARYKLFAPWRVVFEVGTRNVLLLSLGDRQALLPGQAPTDATAPDDEARAAAGIGWHAVKVAFDGQRVSAVIDKLAEATLPPAVKPGTTAPVAVTLPGDPRRFRYATGVQLRRQVWRWRGRPLPPFPFEAGGPGQADEFPTPSDPTDTPRNLMLWDAPGFGDRSGIDMLDENRQVGYPTPRAELFGEALTDDPRALYYRFNPQFTSRYAGLFPRDPPALIAARYNWVEMPGRSSSDRWQTALTPWRRLVVPCRRTAEVPRPVVRFLVPLTQPDGNPGRAGTPGLLAILDEPAFAIGGLAEVVEADVVRVDDPWKGQSPVSRPEFGPDPTLRGQGWTKAAKGGTGDDPPDDALPVDVEGPIGHTFDTEADAPLFATSSYFVKPPDVAPINKDPSLAWYFAKVRLRRLLLPEGMAGYQPLGTPESITGGQAKEYTLAGVTSKEPLVITLSALAVPAGGGLDVDFPDTSGSSLGTVAAAWIPVDTAVPAKGNHWSLSFKGPGLPSATITFPSGAVDLTVGALDADLRFVFQQDEAVGLADPPPPPPLHLTVSYRLRAPAGVERPNSWRTLLATPWPANSQWPAKLTVRATVSGKDIAVIPPRTSAARVSRFTAPYWVQFLPDSGVLLPQRAGDYQARWHAPDRTLPDQQNATPSLELLDPDSGTAVDPVRVWGLGRSSDWPPADEGVQTRFVRRLLLTEVVRDVRGQLGQERYLGLYEPVTAGTMLHCVHRSPALAPFECEEKLERVRLRVVEFQEDAGRAVDPNRRLDSALPTVWDDAAGPANSAAQDRSADSPARVVRVSLPATLHAAPAPVPAAAPIAPHSNT